MSDLAVIGDVGGHRSVLRSVVRDLGGDLDRAELPSGLIIIQVGDLIGDRPDDVSLLASVRHMQERHPGRWIQLVGNWEARFLGGPPFVKRGSIEDGVPSEVQAVWTAGHLIAAVSVRSQRGGEALITHAGLKHGFWSSHAGTVSAPETAVVLRGLALQSPEVFFAAGSLAGSPGEAGPVWAKSGTELWASWEDVEPPFSQVHGHSQPYFFPRQQWDDDVPASLRSRATIDRTRRHITWRAGEHRIIGIDPSLGPSPRPKDLTPLVLRGASLALDA